jgi:hypothetical protein
MAYQRPSRLVQPNLHIFPLCPTARNDSEGFGCAVPAALSSLQIRLQHVASYCLDRAAATQVPPLLKQAKRVGQPNTLMPRGARVSAARGAVILPLLLQESGEVVRAEPGVEEHLAVVLGDPAPQLGVDRDLALARLR